MEIEQEVSDVVQFISSGIPSAIAERRIASTVALQSGQTVALGGLIEDDVEEERSGVAFISRLPVIGWLFGSTVNTTERHELPVLITPRLERDAEQARSVTEELRHRLGCIAPVRERSVECRHMRVAEGRSRGIALISVLWVTVLLATLAASLTSSTRTHSRIARNQLENAKAEALADGGVYWAILGLLEFDPEELWRADSAAHVLQLPGGDVRIWIEDEDAKIDLNAAPPELIAGLFAVLGLPEEDAAMVADRIADFRDQDDEARPLGAEDDAYAAAGLDHGAKDAPLIDRGELLTVLGMTPDLYARARPHVTVLSGGEGIDPLRASRTVLAAIPGITPDVIEALATAPPDEDPFMMIDDEVLFDIELYLLFSREIMYTIKAEARTDGGGVFVREVSVELFAGEDLPFRVYSWGRGSLD